MNTFKRLLATALTLCLFLQLLPAGALAREIDATDLCRTHPHL